MLDKIFTNPFIFLTRRNQVDYFIYKKMPISLSSYPFPPLEALFYKEKILPIFQHVSIIRIMAAKQFLRSSCVGWLTIIWVTTNLKKIVIYY